MTTSKRSKSWAEQLADLEDPTPKDFDPENIIGSDHSSGSEREAGEEAGAREHYLDVGKSTLRQPNSVELGPRYTGASISRDDLTGNESEDEPFGIEVEEDLSEEDHYADPEQELNGQLEVEDGEIDSGEAFGSGDEDRFAQYTFRSNKDPQAHYSGVTTTAPISYGENARESEENDSVQGIGGGFEDNTDGDNDSDDIHISEHDQSDESHGEESSISSAPSSPKDDRAALRQMMADDQKIVAASFSKTAKADIEKGRAVKKQRSTFDALLNTRIKLQKALVSTNSMPISAPVESSTDPAEITRAAEVAALNLWNSLNDLRMSLQTPANPKKRSFSATTTTSSSDIWTDMQSQESHFLPQRRSTLSKWSQKTNPAAAISGRNKFSQVPTQQPLTSVLDQQLSGTSMDRLVARTKIPRSCAPTQANQRVQSDENIYDDADFYTLLLRELIDQRMADTSISSTSNNNPTIPALPTSHDLTVRKQVDTKASKGRKMRYTVHEKLQNFMAPDDRGSWGERQREELFAGLLGRRIRLDEGVEREADNEGDEGEGDEMEGFRLFG